jgi:hypothetical protein
MKTKNLDEGDANKSRFAGAARHRNHPFSKTTPFADISNGVVSNLLCSPKVGAGAPTMG